MTQAPKTKTRPLNVSSNPLIDLVEVRNAIMDGEAPTEIVGEFGSHGVDYGADQDGIYVRVGMVLPDGLHAEIEDGTYGELNAIRFYLVWDCPDDVVETDSGHTIEMGMSGSIEVRDHDGNHVDSVMISDDNYPQLLKALVQGIRSSL